MGGVAGGGEARVSLEARAARAQGHTQAFGSDAPMSTDSPSMTEVFRNNVNANVESCTGSY